MLCSPLNVGPLHRSQVLIQQLFHFIMADMLQTMPQLYLDRAILVCFIWFTSSPATVEAISYPQAPFQCKDETFNIWI